MKCIQCGVLYFALVFGAGFVLGVVRQLLLVPRLGEMWAELLEMPVMFAVIVVAARWVTERFSLPPQAAPRFGMGLVALALLLAAEIGFVLSLRGLPLAEYVARREPVSGAVYLLMLAVFAAMPWALTQRRPRHEETRPAQPI